MQNSNPLNPSEMGVRGRREPGGFFRSNEEPKVGDQLLVDPTPHPL